MGTVDLAKIGANLLKNALTGEMVELKSLWKDQTSVLFFLRRFGCQVCRWTAKEVSKLKESFDEHQICLIGVGPEDVGLKEFLDGNFFSGGIMLCLLFLLPWGRRFEMWPARQMPMGSKVTS
ncbi:hypothetical protein FKM82_013659 [Ascaphus truei]